MKRNPNPSKRNKKDLHESAKTETPSLPQLLLRPPTEEFPTIPNPMMSSSRDLVPPSGLNRLPPPLTVSAPLPPLPAVWEGTEDMKMCLHAKIEEDRRKQQEEMTQQANLILEQRRIEKSILSDAVRARIPPKLVPLIFNGIYTTGADELQRKCSAPEISQQQNQGIMPPTRLPVAPKPSQQILKQHLHAKASELSPMDTNHIPETRHSRWSEDISNRHRERMISSEREQLKRKLRSQNKKVADKDLLDTAFEHTFPVTQAMILDLPPRYLVDPSDRASGTQEKRQRAPQEAHHGSSKESGRQQFPSLPQQQLQMPSNPVSVSKAPSYLHSEKTNSPSPKRKDQRLHKKVPPPQYRRSETLLGQQDPFDESQLDQKPQQRGLSSADESRTCDGGSSEQPTDLTLDSAGKSSDSS
ncbi:hypothetical protein N7463_003745 [Penicillium fimorum]|uniref:Uncharacterized protein n=1 Tax=Penicillium fimorum TaxID=1882269 RepID=A0A9W9Y1R6_9EURO|nr:hypothetical protein N7463_003745 [Penicillium fimorum]